jgi:DNA-binding NarL/FixJ family response regulator
VASERPQKPASPAVGRLSARELEVMRLVAGGSTNVEIGSRLGLSVHAVKFHLASVYRKLGAANRTEAAVVFVNAGSAAPVGSRGEGV